MTPPSASSQCAEVSSAHLAASCIRTSASALARQREQMFSQFVVPLQSEPKSRFVIHAACSQGVHPHPKFGSPSAHCGLTPRSTGPATAGSVRLARSGFATVARQPYAARLRGPVTSNVRPQRMHTPLFNVSSWQLRRPKASLRQARSTVGLPSLKSGLALIAPSRTEKTNDAAFGVEPVRRSKFSASRRAVYKKISVGAVAPTRTNVQSVRGAAAVRTAVALRQARSVRRRGSPAPKLPLAQRTLRPNPSVNRTRYGRQRKAGAQRLRHCRAPALRCLPPRAGYLER
jgi:hypothetical protein